MHIIPGNLNRYRFATQLARFRKSGLSVACLRCGSYVFTFRYGRKYSVNLNTATSRGLCTVRGA